MISLTRIRGSSDEYGSWNMNCRSRRSVRSASPAPLPRSVPSKSTSPRGGHLEPDADAGRASSCRSPTRRPGRTSRRADRRGPPRVTAWTAPTFRRSTPPAVTGNSLLTSLNSRMNSGLAVPVAGRLAGSAALEQLELAAERGHQRLVALRLGQQRGAELAASPRPRRCAGESTRYGWSGLPAQRRVLAAAVLGGERAARREAARQRWPAQVRRQPRDRVQLLALVLVELRDRGQQRLGVGVADAA